MIAQLDGNPLLYPTDSITNAAVTFRRRKEDGSKGISFAADLEFMLEDKDYIESRLVNHPTAQQNYVVLTLIDDCCNGAQYQFKILPESVEWCEKGDQCNIKAHAVEYSVESEQYACLENTLIWDNYNNFQSQQHPRLTYCVEFRPAILQDAMIILLLVIDAILIALVPLIAIVLVLVAAVNLIITIVGGNPIGGGVGNIAGNLLNFFQNFNEFFIGCGRKHPSPFVRSYASNVCGKCGLSFTSSIYNNPASPYHNTVYMNAPVTKGIDRNDNTTYWVDKNKPILNGTLYFDKLAPITNSDWRIRNNQVYFERRDFFITQTPWLDLTTYPQEKIASICWQWSKKKRFAYADIRYGQDAIDWVGNEAIERWSDIIEWNVPPNPAQKGAYEVLFQYGAARFRDDGLERDVLSSYSGWPLVGPIISQFGRVMLMPHGVSFNPKLLIYDDTTPISDARVRLYYPPGNTNAALNQHYNYPFWVDQSTTGNLYDQFFRIEDPRIASAGDYEVEVELIFDCALLAAADADGTITTSKGNTDQIDSIEVDWGRGRMLIRATV